MATPPDVYTWVNGEDLLASDMQTRVEEVLRFAYNPPMVRLRRTAAGTIPNNASTPVQWDTVEIEVTNMWDASDPSKITPSVPGWYVGSCGWSFQGNTTGARMMTVHKNGNTGDAVIRAMNTAYANAAWNQVARGNVFLEYFNGTTDYIQMYLFQNSGSTLSLQVSAQGDQPDMTLRWIAKT